MPVDEFDSKRPFNSFEDVISVYYALKTLGYTDSQLRDICGFLHDALNLYLINLERTDELKI